MTGGLSTKLAGKIFGFDPDCADFGPEFDIAKVFGVIGGGITVGEAVST